MHVDDGLTSDFVQLISQATESIMYHSLQSLLLERYAQLNHHTPVYQMVYLQYCITCFRMVFPSHSHL